MKDRSGALGRTATGIFGPGLAKPSMKASRKTSLPSVMASPVKGGGAFDGDLIANATTNLGEEDLELEQQSNVTPPPAMSGSKTSEDASNEASFVIEELVMSTDKGKEREEWDSRRASSALHALSQSLSVLPETPLKPVVIGTRTGLRSSSSTYHAVSGSSSKSAVDTKNKGKGKEGTDGAAPQRSVPSKSDAAASPVEGGSAGKKGALKVLKKCAIFVDVRTDDGDDAGSLFVDMLRGLGARILGRIGQSCTHIVYKNGSASTLARYRLLNDPKPVVVGIAWVVECVEQRSRVDEVKFKVDLELVNVSGTNKRRRSMLPKHMSSLANGVGPCYIPVDLSSDDNEGRRQPNDGDGSPGTFPGIFFVRDYSSTSFCSTRHRYELQVCQR
ncbi:hypothetical protein M405DRAFT_735316 [Rhizopogon salebrosus TDB-379]|nr:hypothetical protein M405DRAFT_735316 [Rhizopogon salebrosus TDB-379]